MDIKFKDKNWLLKKQWRVYGQWIGNQILKKCEDFINEEEYPVPKEKGASNLS